MKVMSICPGVDSQGLTISGWPASPRVHRPLQSVLHRGCRVVENLPLGSRRSCETPEALEEAPSAGQPAYSEPANAIASMAGFSLGECGSPRGAAQQTEPGKTLVTGSVWDAVADNDFLAFSCGCNEGVQGGEPCFLWEELTLEKIPDAEKYGQVLNSGWCVHHGEEYCNAILQGNTHRSDIPEELRSKQTLLASGSESIKVQARKEREQDRRALQEEIPRRDPRFSSYLGGR